MEKHPKKSNNQSRKLINEQNDELKNWIRTLQRALTVEVDNGFKNLHGRNEYFNAYLSREFKSSLNEIADHEDFKDVKSSLSEVNKIKDDLNIKGKFKSEIKSLKETSEIIEKEVKDLKNLENEINSTKETSSLVAKDVHDKNKNKTQDEADLI